MKRFEKIWDAPPDTHIDIFSLPKKKVAWGGALCREPENDISLYCHETGLFIFVESGQFAIRSESYSSVCHPRTALYIPPTTPYIFQQIGQGPYGWFVSLPLHLCKRLPAVVKNYDVFEPLVGIGKEIASWKSEVPTPASLFYAKTFVHQIEKAKDANVELIRMPKSKRLLVVAQHLIANPGDTNTLNYWAKEAGMSRRSFTRIFKKETSRSFDDWRTILKIQTAIHRLGAGATVADISYELGYETSSSFGRAFKKLIGKTPIEVAKEKRTGKAIA